MAESSNDLEKARKSIQTAREKAEDYKKRIDAAQTAFDAAILDAQSKNENKSSDEHNTVTESSTEEAAAIPSNSHDAPETIVDNEIDDNDDPVIAEYDIYLTDSDVQRYLFQYPDRDPAHPYNSSTGKLPTELRIKHETGIVELDVPIDTTQNYDVSKGAKYGEAMRRVEALRDNKIGGFGMAGGFSGGVGSSAGVRGAAGGGNAGLGTTADGETFDLDLADVDEEGNGAKLLDKMTLRGRFNQKREGDPVYMLGAFRGNELHVSPLDGIVQLRPQVDHVDAIDELAARSKLAISRARRDGDGQEAEGQERAGAQNKGKAAETKAIDQKVRSADDDLAAPDVGELLRKMSEDKWARYKWVDDNSPAAWEAYNKHMFHPDTANAPDLKSPFTNEEYLDALSCPRVDPSKVGAVNNPLQQPPKARAPAPKKK